MKAQPISPKLKNRNTLKTSAFKSKSKESASMKRNFQFKLDGLVKKKKKHSDTIKKWTEIDIFGTNNITQATVTSQSGIEKCK